MPNQTAHRLSRLNDQIMKAWEERALMEVKAATHQEKLALHNSLPEFLSQISTALSTTINRTDARVKFDRSESERVGRKHGSERADSLHYTMDQLIFEYHILRQVIFDEMEKEAPLSVVETEVIICAIEQAVNDAATQFSDSLTETQDTFTNTLAHDLRGPISTTKLSAQLILKKANNPDQCINLAGRISTMMDRLDGMIFDLLDVGRMKAGQKLDLALDFCDLDETMRYAVEEKNFLHNFRVKYKTEGSVQGMWDDKGMRRVFDNLLSNALKYSPEGTNVSVEMKKTGNNVIIKFQNSGKPIPPNELSTLFHQYNRSKKTDDKPGWGLGLTVVKGITEAHKGSAGVTSTDKEGTIFTITLPIIFKGYSDEKTGTRSQSARIPE